MIALTKVAPIFRSIPPLVVGMPVVRVNERFNCVMPNALLHEKLNPGIFVFVISFLFNWFVNNDVAIVCTGSPS